MVHLVSYFPLNVQIILVMASRFHVDPDITKASTLPAAFYTDPEVFDGLREKVFRPSWQYIHPQCLPAGENRAIPFSLLDGYLKVPLLLSRAQDDALVCLSNVCTHRGNLLLTGPSGSRKLVCGYHGRRFALDGTFEFMPEFEQAAAFPSECDHLPRFPLTPWGPMWFISLEPAFPFHKVVQWMEERVGFLPIQDFKLAGERSKTYEVKAHWALYCDNYLEGFHIPFVHKALDAVLDYGQYDTLLSEHGSLQIGHADARSGSCFDLPPGHVDFGKNVAAYYYWVFPNLMFNFYPWGLSLNVVVPVSRTQTRVHFSSYVWDASKLEEGAGGGLDRVELEDEAVVEGVQQGIQSPFYDRGRFSPTREKGVHHFHRMLAKYMHA